MFLVGFIFDILLILSLTSKRKAVISKRRATDFKFLLDVFGNFKPKWFSFAEAQTLLAGGARRSPIWPGVTSAADILGGKRWHVDEDHVKPTRAGNGRLAPPLDDSLTKQLARLQPCVTLLFFFFLLALALISGAPTAGTLLGSSSKCEVKLMAKKLDNKIQQLWIRFADFPLRSSLPLLRPSYFHSSIVLTSWPILQFIYSFSRCRGAMLRVSVLTPAF